MSMKIKKFIYGLISVVDVEKASWVILAETFKLLRTAREKTSKYRNIIKRSTSNENHYLVVVRFLE